MLRNTNTTTNNSSIKFNVIPPGTDYNSLLNLPAINNVKLVGNLSTKDLNIKEGIVYEAGENIIIKNDVISAIVPTKTSQLKNDSNYVDSDYVENSIKVAIGKIETVKFVILDVLPEKGQGSTIYFIPKKDTKLSNVYEEYIWIDNKYEMIGSTDIDLSNYYTKKEVDDLISEERSKLAMVATTGSYNDLKDKPKDYELPKATNEQLGGVVVGAGLNIDEGGILSVSSTVTSNTFVFEQDVASKKWEIVHNLNKFPSVTIVDSAMTAVVGDVQYIDKSKLIVSFSLSFSGKAYLN